MDGKRFFTEIFSSLPFLSRSADTSARWTFTRRNKEPEVNECLRPSMMIPGVLPPIPRKRKHSGCWC